MRYDRSVEESALSNSGPKRPPPPDGPMSVTGLYVPWRLAPPKPGETVRWHNVVDGRWVVVARGSGDEAGKSVVTSSDGQRQVVADHDSALALAKKWRA